MIDEVRLVITAEPPPWPSRVQVCEPLALTQSPCWATPAINMSLSCLDDRKDRLPHSDDKPARLAVAETHGPGAGRNVGPVTAGAVVVGAASTAAVDSVVALAKGGTSGRAFDPHPNVARAQSVVNATAGAQRGVTRTRAG